MVTKKDQTPAIVKEMRNLAANRGGQKPVSLVLHDLPIAALASKLVKPHEQSPYKGLNSDKLATMTATGIDQISKSIMHRIEDNENIFKLFPDIQLASQILISSILSPKDMIQYELIYRVKESVFSATLTTKLLEIIRSSLETEYKVKDDLPEILKKALFETGSAIKIVLPEALIDQVINQTSVITTESIKNSELFTQDLSSVRSKGILGDPHRTEKETTGKTNSVRVLEAFSNQSNNYVEYNSTLFIPSITTTELEGLNVQALATAMRNTVEVTDNYDFIKYPLVLEAINKQKLNEITGSKLKRSARKFATESSSFFKEKEKRATPAEMEAMLYKASNRNYAPFQMLPTRFNLLRKSVGKPLVIDAPSEAMIPVHIPGNYSKHEGYFMPIDIDGNAVTITTDATYGAAQGLASMLQSGQANSSFGSLLTDKARQNITSESVVPIIDRAADLYASLVENDLLQRLAKGTYGKNLQVSRNPDIYRIMLARSLQGQMTRLIYIPAEYVSYFAFDYHRNGVGKSYLDDLSNIASFRAMVMFSKVMAKIKSSITTTNAKITFDPRDPDPVKTIETVKNYVAKSRQQYFPHGLSNVADLTDWIHRAGIQITYEGHPDLPETKIDFESKNIQHTEPDDELDELFRHQMYMHFGLSPETVDNAAKSDFATTIQNNSVLFARRVFMLSNMLSVMATDYGRKIVSNDQEIIDSLISILKEHKAELLESATDEEKELAEKDEAGYYSYILEAFMDIFQIDLPKPDSTRNESMKKEFEEFEQAVDAAMKYVFSDEVLSEEFAGQAAGYMSNIQKAWKGEIMRSWMANNNYLPELFGIVGKSEDGKTAKLDLLEAVKNHSEAVMINVVGLIKSMRGVKLAANRDLTKLTGEEEPSSSGAGESSSGEDGDASIGSGDGGSGESLEGKQDQIDDLTGANPFNTLPE